MIYENVSGVFRDVSGERLYLQYTVVYEPDLTSGDNMSAKVQFIKGKLLSFIDYRIRQDELNTLFPVGRYTQKVDLEAVFNKKLVELFRENVPVRKVKGHISKYAMVDRLASYKDMDDDNIYEWFGSDKICDQIVCV